MDYSDNRKRHLSKYIQEKGLANVMGGNHNGGTKEYDHIIKVKNTIDKKDQYQKVVTYNLLPNVPSNMLKIDKLHPMAHYLTSSQIVCYNFFRPLLDNALHPTSKFIEMLHSKGIVISTAAEGEFEYNAPEYGRDGRLEHTEFDFHLIDNTTGTEVFFEIKYTESEFGKWGKHATTKNYENFYHDMFSYCYALDKSVPVLEDFSKKFQLYRNALRVRRPNQYSIFVYPEKNEKVHSEFKEFKKVILHTENVFAWTWEELTSGAHDSEFYKKYFG